MGSFLKTSCGQIFLGDCPNWWGIGGAGYSAPPVSPPPPPCPAVESHFLILGSLWVGPKFPTCSPHRPTVGLRRQCRGARCRRGGGRAGV